MRVGTLTVRSNIFQPNVIASDKRMTVADIRYMTTADVQSPVKTAGLLKSKLLMT